jgi:hypothetical protein
MMTFFSGEHGQAPGGMLQLITVVVLVILLLEKQRVAPAVEGRAKQLNRALNIAILPLLLTFVFNVIVVVGASMVQGK